MPLGVKSFKELSSPYRSGDSLKYIPNYYFTFRKRHKSYNYTMHHFQAPKNGAITGECCDKYQCNNKITGIHPIS